MFSLTFATTNAAFDDEPWIEAERILRSVADLVEEGYTQGIVDDINGNGIGRWEWTPSS